MAPDPPYDCRFTRTALRQMRRCPKSRVILAWLDRTSKNPFRPDNNVKPLSGVDNGYRRRFGDWRVSYLVNRDGRVIEVFEVAPRGGAYR